MAKHKGKAPKPKAKPGKRRADPKVSEYNPETDSCEGLTDWELSELTELLDNIAGRIERQAKTEKWPDEKIQDELGWAKQLLEDTVSGWAAEESQTFGVPIQSLNEQLSGAVPVLDRMAGKSKRR